MDRVKVEDISNFLNTSIISSYLVVQKELRKGVRDFYVRLKLSDNSGAIGSNIWNNAQSISKQFKEGDVIKVKATVGKYRDNFQLTINNLRVMNPDEYDLSEYMTTTPKDRDILAKELFDFIDNITDKKIVELLKAIFEDKEFFSQFLQSPAAKSWHHNYIGGLIEHTMAVTKLCNFASQQYPVNKDLLIGGALLHDIGKVFEYSVKNVIDFSDEGRLIGHICLADRFICRKAEEINDFPKETLMKIRHLVLSHQGEYENATARLPQTIEAFILYFADNMDAQAAGVNQTMLAVMNDKAKWTEYNVIHNRYFYMG